ncbi:MAG: amino acid ABC transporter substrate-binding protein [Armatimonadetes bacterium]|nr:amino acid ABC transporter substrate-binding protein [Armatimonadota bacterium]MDW8153908.1 amino acid ABC transporter substrate-binding protein [Armatimonadota bacterium]
MAHRIDRRQFLKVAAGATATALLPQSWARAQARPVRIGFAISETGPLGVGARLTTIPNYYLWRDEVNARGGLLVRGEGRRPVEFVNYDDRSDVGTCVRLYERLIREDRVDLVLPPYGTAIHFAVAPVVSRLGYVLLGVTVGSLRIRELGAENFFALLPQPDSVTISIVQFLREVRERHGWNRVALLHIADLHGVEHHNAILPLLRRERFEIVEDRSYPLVVTDLSDVIRALQARRPEIVVAFSYPADSPLLVRQSIALGFSPPVFILGVGAFFREFAEQLGGNVEGIICHQAAWSPKLRFPGTREYYEAFRRKFGRDPDYAGSSLVYQSLKMLEQAVAEVGLDQRRIKEYFEGREFNGPWGPVKFERGVNRAGSYVGRPNRLGQWQRGGYEVIWPTEYATARPIIPKPAWK